jgi:hypothetical protein
MSSLDKIAASQSGYVANGSALNSVAASQPAYVADGSALSNLKAGSMMGTAGKALSTYNTVNNATNAGQPPPRRAPPARPIYQGQAAPIAPDGSNTTGRSLNQTSDAMRGLVAKMAMRNARRQ